MKKLVLIILILTLALLASPNQSYAAWWNPFSWFSRDKQAEEQKQPKNVTSNPTTQEPQTVNQNVEAAKKQNTVAPLDNTQSSDTKTIEALKAEVATLKTNLDTLYKAHSNLVNDHNALLKYVNATVSTDKNVGATTNNSNLEASVTNLEKKLNDVCAQIFSSLSGLSINKCPSSQFLIKETLEYRIKKLEGGY